MNHDCWDFASPSYLGRRIQSRISLKVRRHHCLAVGGSLHGVLGREARLIWDLKYAITDAAQLVPVDGQSAFDSHSAKHFSVACQGQPIDRGAASFWLLVRDLPVLNR